MQSLNFEMYLEIFERFNLVRWFHEHHLYMHFIRSHPLAKKLFLNHVLLWQKDIKETLKILLKMFEVNAAT